MKKLYIEPIINISVFNSESIVTVSAGTPQNADTITADNYAIIRADWAAAADKITFIF